MINRRSFLTRYGAGAAGVLVGSAGADLATPACTSSVQHSPRAASPSRPRPSGPDPQLADLHAEQALVALYDAAINTRPSLAATLRPIRTDHATHLAALRKLVGAAAAPPSPTSSGHPISGSHSSGPVPSGARVPTSGVPGSSHRLPTARAALLAALRSAERTAAAARAESCYAATGTRAGLLGAISASESSHAVAL